MMQLTLGDRADLAWAQDVVTRHHYLRQPVDPRARPMVYTIGWREMRVGLVMLGIPHATKCTGWWGYPGLITQWQVVDLCRIWIDPDFQRGGAMCTPEHVPGYHDRRGTWRTAGAHRRHLASAGRRPGRGQVPAVARAHVHPRIIALIDGSPSPRPAGAFAVNFDI